MQVRTRTKLNAESYAKAYQAHVSERTYIKVAGCSIRLAAKCRDQLRS